MSMPYATAYELNILEKQLTEKIKEAAINGVDTNPTKLSELQNDVGYITNSALTAYARKVEIPTRVSQLQNDSKYITNAALNDYAKTSDLSSFATKTEVNAIAANIPSTDGLATESQLNEVKNSIPTDYITSTTAANFALKSEIPDVSNFVTTSQLNEVEAKIPMDYVTTATIANYALKTEIPDVSGFATTAQLEAVEANIPTDVVTSAQLNSVEEKIPTDYLTQDSLANYALKSEIPNVSGFATTAEVEAVANNIPTDYVTTSEIANYALKTEIPDVSNFVTDAELNAVAANIPTDYIPNSQLNTLATKEEVESKQDKIVEISGTFDTDGTGEKKVSGEFTETEGGQSLALNFYNLGAPTFIRFNPMSYTKKIYTAEELYAWFGVTDIASLRGAVSRNNIFVLAFGIASMGIGHMQYRILAQYIEIGTDELPQIIIKAFGPDYSNDKLCQYIITANTDGTPFGDTGCNVQVEKIAVQS